MRLTQTRVNELLASPPDGEKLFSCGQIPRLFLRFKNGRGTWVHISVEEGKKRKRKIAPGALPLKDARTRALVYNTPGAFSDVSLKELMVRYLKASGHKSAAKDWRRFQLHVGTALAGKPATEVTPLDMIAVHARVSEHCPTQANRLIESVRAAYNWGNKVELIASKNPPGVVKMNRLSRRSRYLSQEEMVRYLQALAGDPNQVASIALRFLLATGLRMNEALALKWTDVDLQNGQILVKQGKTGDYRRLFISDYIHKLLNSLPKNSQYLFPGKCRDFPINNIRKCHHRALTSARISGVTIHDLRRTYATMLATSGVELLAISKALGHKNTRTTQIYAQITDDRQKNSADIVSALLENCR